MLRTKVVFVILVLYSLAHGGIRLHCEIINDKVEWDLLASYSVQPNWTYSIPGARSFHFAILDKNQTTVWFGNGQNDVSSNIINALFYNNTYRFL